MQSRFEGAASWSPAPGPGSAPRSRSGPRRRAPRRCWSTTAARRPGRERTAEAVREAGAQAELVQGDITSWDDIKRMADVGVR